MTMQQAQPSKRAHWHALAGLTLAAVAALSACTRFDAAKLRGSTELHFRSLASGDHASSDSGSARLMARAQTLLAERFGDGAALQVKAGQGPSPSLVVDDPEVAAFLTSQLPLHLAVRLGVERRPPDADEDVDVLHLKDRARGRGADDSCATAKDGECDEPLGCAPGTDLSDCGRPLFVLRDPAVDEKDLAWVRPREPQILLLGFEDEGASRLDELARNSPRDLAVIYVDGSAISACRISDCVSGGSLRLEDVDDQTRARLGGNADGSLVLVAASRIPSVLSQHGTSKYPW